MILAFSNRVHPAVQEAKALLEAGRLGLLGASVFIVADQTRFYRLNRDLKFDLKTELFQDSEANAMLTREYRKPFVAPAKV